MHIPARIAKSFGRCIAAISSACLLTLASAHDAKVGDIHIEHPYATPSLAGVTTGAAYLVALENTGKTPDKLVQATATVCASVEMHTMAVDAQGVMRMRQVDAIALAPNASVKMVPGSGYHLMLVGLNRPLKDGDSFPMTLQFEHAGKVEVKVVVQPPHASADMAGMPGMADMHKH